MLAGAQQPGQRGDTERDERHAAETLEQAARVVRPPSIGGTKARQRDDPARPHRGRKHMHGVGELGPRSRGLHRGSVPGERKDGSRKHCRNGHESVAPHAQDPGHEFGRHADRDRPAVDADEEDEPADPRDQQEIGHPWLGPLNSGRHAADSPDHE